MDLPKEVPVMTLPGAILFPQAMLPLYIFEPRYRQMLAYTLKGQRMFSVAMQKPGQSREVPCPVAGLGLIRVSVDHSDGTSHLILQGITRVELKQTLQYRPYRIQTIKPLKAKTIDSVVIDALLAKVFELVEQRIETGSSPFPFPLSKTGGKSKGGPKPKLTVKEILSYLENLPDADQITDLVSCALLSNARERQTILETVELEPRLKHLIRFLLADGGKSKGSNDD